MSVTRIRNVTLLSLTAFLQYNLSGLFYCAQHDTANFLIL